MIWKGLHSVKSDASFYRFAAPLEKLLDWLLFEVQQSNADQYGQRSATTEEGIHEELLNDIVKERRDWLLSMPSRGMNDH